MYHNNQQGKKIYYEVLNDKSVKGTIVFLNGVMASTNSWKNQYEAFEKLGYKIILHDFIGQLKSDKFVGQYSFDKHTQDLKGLLDELKIEKAHLIGTSYGGEVAMKYAINYPFMVESLSIIDSVSEVDDQMVKSIEEWIELAVTGSGEEFFNGMLPSIYGKTYIKENSDFLSKRAKLMNNVPLDYFMGQIGLYHTFINDVYMTNVLHKINCPTLVVCGKDDILKPVKFSKLIQDNIKGSVLVLIPDCGHVTILEKPNELNDLLMDFINKE